MFDLTFQQAYDLNQWIDNIHNPYVWSYGAVISIYALLESYLPKRQFVATGLDSFLNGLKFFFLFAFALIFFSQGLLGGCFIQIPQNLIAQKFLNREYWYPFGLVYREQLDPRYWPFLRGLYLVLGLYGGYRTVIYYQKFINLKAKIKDSLSTIITKFYSDTEAFRQLFSK
ncbi:MAG: hypothetical protein WCK98_00875 [bacterium]